MIAFHQDSENVFTPRCDCISGEDIFLRCVVVTLKISGVCYLYQKYLPIVRYSIVIIISIVN